MEDSAKLQKSKQEKTEGMTESSNVKHFVGMHQNPKSTHLSPEAEELRVLHTYSQYCGNELSGVELI
jgi:hypothetical protein